MASKPTERQKKILEAMAEGARLILHHGFIPSAILHPPRMGLTIRADDPYHLERKGRIVAVARDWNRTAYKIREPQP